MARDPVPGLENGQRSGTGFLTISSMEARYPVLIIMSTSELYNVINGNILFVHKGHLQIQREHMFNRVSSYFPKGGHSATKTELKII